MAVSFDLYGTLVTAERPAEPWTAVADELVARDVPVPADWEDAYRTSHLNADPLAELSLIEHTLAALESRGVYADADVVSAALLAAFDGRIRRVDGADAAVEAAATAGSIGILSNCSLPGLVESSLGRVDLPVSFDAVVTSVDCGWRKPHDRAFEAVAAALGCEPAALVHVGDDHRTDGGGRTAGVTVVLTGKTPLADVPARLEASE